MPLSEITLARFCVTRIQTFRIGIVYYNFLKKKRSIETRLSQIKPNKCFVFLINRIPNQPVYALNIFVLFFVYIFFFKLKFISRRINRLLLKYCSFFVFWSFMQKTHIHTIIRRSKTNNPPKKTWKQKQKNPKNTWHPSSRSHSAVWRQCKLIQIIMQ